MLAFWRHGFEATSISDLTAAMGVTAPSLYTAFGDKKRLFLEAVRLYAGDPDELSRRLDGADTAREAARNMLASAAEAFTAPGMPRGCLLASSTASVSAAAEDVQRAVADVRAEIMARLAARISRDVVEGQLPATTAPDTLAALIVATIQGMSVLARDGAARADLLALSDCAMQAWPPATA